MAAFSPPVYIGLVGYRLVSGLVQGVLMTKMGFLLMEFEN